MRRSVTIVLALFLVSILTACAPAAAVPQSISEADIEATVQQKLADSLTETAVFQAALSEQMTAQAPAPSETPTTAPEATETAAPTDTPAVTEEPKLEPTSENPWILQSWCEEHEGCVVYEVRNKTDDWLQVSLTKTDTQDTGFFSVRGRTTGYITLMAGQYDAQYTWWCKGEIGSMRKTWPAGLWIDIFECPEGYKYSIKK